MVRGLQNHSRFLNLITVSLYLDFTAALPLSARNWSGRYLTQLLLDPTNSFNLCQPLYSNVFHCCFRVITLVGGERNATTTKYSLLKSVVFGSYRHSD
jgi:hypothetical protein